MRALGVVWGIAGIAAVLVYATTSLGGCALQAAALTGHLVFSTIHTNNTVATITRLRDLGVPSYLISSTIIGIIAQRLVRVICPFCKEEYRPSDDSLRGLALTPKQVRNHSFVRGKGCGKCGETGYKGRVGIYEMLVLSQKIKEAIATEASEGQLRQLAVAEGMKALSHAGVERLMQGTTTVEEVLRAIQTDEDFGSLCPACTAILGPGFIACPECGKKLIETCPSCSKTLDAGWKYCPYCTAKLPGAGQAQQVQESKIIPMGKERSACQSAARSKSLVVLRELDAQAPPLVADESHVRLAIRSLLDLALRLVPEGGDLYLGSAWRPKGEGSAAGHRMLRFHSPEEVLTGPSGEPDGEFLEVVIARDLFERAGGSFAIDASGAQDNVILVQLPG